MSRRHLPRRTKRKPPVGTRHPGEVKNDRFEDRPPSAAVEGPTGSKAGCESEAYMTATEAERRRGLRSSGLSCESSSAGRANAEAEPSRRRGVAGAYFAKACAKVCAGWPRWHGEHPAMTALLQANEVSRRSRRPRAAGGRPRRPERGRRPNGGRSG